MRNRECQQKQKVLYVIDDKQSMPIEKNDVIDQQQDRKAENRFKNSKFKNTTSTPTTKRRKIDENSSIETKSKESPSSRNGKPIDKIQILKYVLIGCTLLILLVNFGLLALGTFLKADLSFSQFLSENYRQVTATQFTAPTLYKGAYAIIILSALAIIVNIAGCCGVVQNSVCLLAIHSGILFVLFMVQLTLAILWYFRREAIENELGVALDYMVQHYYQGAGIVQEVLDSLQTTFRCCGNAGCGDFIALRLILPRTCDLDCYGCRERILRFLRDGMTVVTVFGSFMLIAELLSIVISAYLLCKLKENPSSRNPATVYEMTYEPQKSQLVARKLKVSNKLGSDNKDEKVVYLSYPVHSRPSKDQSFR